MSLLAPARPRLLPWALLCLAISMPARPAIGAPDEGIPASWVTIATIEHRRGDPAGLDPFLAPTADKEDRNRALIALGRIGDRKGVESRLRAAIRQGNPGLERALWAAGISEVKGLVPDILPILVLDPKTSGSTIDAALEALGMIGDARANGFVRPFLSAEDPRLVVTALNALWRMGAEQDLDAVAKKLASDDANVRRAACAATWRLAGARRKALSKPDAPWGGDLLLADAVVQGSMSSERPSDDETYLFGLRALNVLLPKELPRMKGSGASPPDFGFFAFGLLGGTRAKYAQAAADVAFRLGASHTGLPVEEALAFGTAHADPLVRFTAVEALGTLGTPTAGDLLIKARAAEQDVRVREAIAVALSACGNDTEAQKMLTRDDRPKDPVARALTQARVALASKTDGAVARTITLAKEPGFPAAARAEILDGLLKKDGEGIEALARESLKDPDVVVRANAAALLAKKAGSKALPELVAAYRPDAGRLDQDFRGALVAAYGEIAGEKAATSENVTAAAAAIEKALSDPAPAVRLAARDAAKSIPSLSARSKEEDPAPADWQGLPRPKGVVLGLDLTKGGPWLSEEEILRLARAIEDQKAHVVFETDAGTIRFTLAPKSAPVHSVNLVLAAAAGVYDGTPWHRVVPAFVIQGGDPRGDGSGDAGYAVPDEINGIPFTSGTLGMPKSTKDTGGCQVFVMHTAAPHLDDRYTAFGMTPNLDVVNRIRVGDKILRARVEAGS